MASAIDRIPASRWEGLAPTTERGRFVALATCACGATERWSAQSMPAPEIVIGKFKQKGWAFRHRKPICNACQRPAKEETVKPDTPTLRAVPPAPKPEPTDAAKAMRRLAYVAIEDGYDEAAKRYKAGYTDASIAKDVGCLEKLIADIREQFFGPAAPPEPPEIAELRAAIEQRTAELTEARETLARIDGDLGAMRFKFDGLCERFGWDTL